MDEKLRDMYPIIGACYLMMIILLVCEFLPTQPQHFPLGKCYEDDGVSKYYHHNWQVLVESLAFSALRSTDGFATGTVGWEPNQVYGLAMCYGDATPRECGHCIRDILEHVDPPCAAPIVWFEHCMIRYAPTDFLGVVDTLNATTWCAPGAVNDTALFDEKVRMLVDNLITEVAAANGSKMFAAGVVPFEENLTIRALAQCTRDISPGDCSHCLETLNSQIGPARGRQEGFFATGSCIVRYRVPELPIPSSPPPPPPPPPL